MNNYYTYMYCREDGTPYYIGKGKGQRINNPHRCGLPPVERRKYLKTNLAEEESFRHEMYMIHVLGRKDNGTGILRNLTDGGEGNSGCIQSEETVKKRVQSRRGYKPPEELKKRISKTLIGHKHSEETRKKISKTLTGYKRPKEVVDRMVETKKRNRIESGKTPWKKPPTKWRGKLLSELTPEEKEERKWEIYDKRFNIT